MAEASQPPEAEGGEKQGNAGGTLLAPGVKQVLALRQMEARAAAELAKTSWGQNMDVGLRRAVADYARRHRIDAATEIDVLGGRVYLNSRFYLRRCAELTEDGVIEWHRIEHIEEDPRLKAASETPAPAGLSEAEQAAYADHRLWALRERLLRQQARISYAIPDSAVSAAVFTVKAKEMEHPVTAAKWAGGKGKATRSRRDGSTYESDVDPIGDAFPVETSESRAMRRCLRTLISHVPRARDALEKALLEADDLTEIIVEDRAAERELLAGQPPKDGRPMARLQPGEPGGDPIPKGAALRRPSTAARAIPAGASGFTPDPPGSFDDPDDDVTDELRGSTDPDV